MLLSPAPVALGFPQDPDPGLAELLKRHSPGTLEAARRLRAGERSSEVVRLFVRGVLGRHVRGETAGGVPLDDETRRLAADLGLDSLSLMEMVVVVEETLGVNVPPERLRRLHTVGDVLALILEARAPAGEPSDAAHGPSPVPASA